jgi:hypothetical protein
MSRRPIFLGSLSLLLAGCASHSPRVVSPAVIAPVVVTPAPQPPVFESRNAAGELLTRLQYERIDHATDAAGHPLPGQLVFIRPTMTCYQDGHPSFQLQADRMQLTVNSGAALPFPVP